MLADQYQIHWKLAAELQMNQIEKREEQKKSWTEKRKEQKKSWAEN